ncbi:MAG: PriCT-2 domain-containing protein, partial [Candidatus Neomarinimicrobiota bacterium]
MEQINLLEVLPYIDPSMLDYQGWVNVGMALKHEGFTAADWDSWSRRDQKRYHPGECFQKWGSFQGTGTPVTGGTIVQLAKDHGWELPQRDEGHELEWDAVIGSKKDDFVIVDKNWIEGKDVIEPLTWNPAAELTKYLEILFEASENVGYVTES